MWTIKTKLKHSYQESTTKWNPWRVFPELALIPYGLEWCWRPRGNRRLTYSRSLSHYPLSSPTHTGSSCLPRVVASPSPQLTVLSWNSLLCPYLVLDSRYPNIPVHMTILYSPGTCMTQVCSSVDRKGPTQSCCGVIYLISSPEWLEQPWNGRFENHQKSLQIPFPLSCTVQGSIKTKVGSVHGFIDHKTWKGLVQLAVSIWRNAANSHNTQYNSHSPQKVKINSSHGIDSSSSLCEEHHTFPRQINT